MWARNLELALGLWLSISPFVFRIPADATFQWANDLTCAALVVLLSISTYWRPMRRAHLAELFVALWLIGYGWRQAHLGEPEPAFQNRLVVGILLCLFAILPSRASEPPAGWREDAAGADRS